MKKFIFSISMTVLFAAYIFYQRAGATGARFASIFSDDEGRIPVPTAQQQQDLAANPPSDQTSLDQTPAPAAAPTPSQKTSSVSSTKKATPTQTAPKGQYVDGSYTGVEADAYYGYIRVRATINGGRLTDVQFLEYPSDHRESVQINTAAMPILRAEAISAQSAQVNTVSRATDSSAAFRQSLSSALAQAKS